jgi:hypothetical protein
MSDFHALTQTENKMEVIFVFHYTTPVGQNAASVDYCDCIKKDLNPSSSLVPDLQTDDPTEYAAILAGEVFEEMILLGFDADMTNQQKLNATEERWTAKNTEFQARIPIVYKFYKMAQDIS